MKKIILLLLPLFAVSQFRAQAQSKYLPEEQDWFFYDLTYVQLLNAPTGYESYFGSNGHNLSVMNDHLLGHSHFSIAYGLGFMSNNYHNNMSIIIDPATGETNYALLKDTADYRNKLTIQYFEIPLEFRFRSKPNEKGNFFRVYVGGKFSLRFNAYGRYKDDNINVRYYNPDELNRIAVGGYMRIGYSFLNLYGYYGFTDVFKEGNLADNGESLTPMRPFAVGISLSL